MRKPFFYIITCLLFYSFFVAVSCTKVESEERSVSFIEALQEKVTTLEVLHEKLSEPKPGDWLSSHPEPGQTVEQYVKSNPVRPGNRWKTIYLLPIGDFTEAQKKVIVLTGEFLSLYYGVPVKVQKQIKSDVIPAKARREHPSWTDAAGRPIKQFLSTYILNDILKPRRPADALVLFGITVTDLWPGRGWNFVYGQASLRERVSVQSIYRNGNPEGSEAEFAQYLRRTLKTATHEMGHVISIHHETTWECNMCGSNNRRESDAHPLYLCPPNLVKVCWACRLDPLKRFKKLSRFCTKHDLESEAVYYKKAASLLEASQ